MSNNVIVAIGLLLLSTGCDRSISPAADDGEDIGIEFLLSSNEVFDVAALPSSANAEMVVIYDVTGGGLRQVFSYHPFGLAPSEVSRPPAVPTSRIYLPGGRGGLFDFGADGVFNLRSTQSDRGDDELPRFEILVDGEWLDGKFEDHLFDTFVTASGSFVFDIDVLTWRSVRQPG